jgi:hypothetical protein
LRNFLINQSSPFISSARQQTTVNWRWKKKDGKKHKGRKMGKRMRHCDLLKEIGGLPFPFPTHGHGHGLGPRNTVRDWVKRERKRGRI